MIRKSSARGRDRVIRKRSVRKIVRGTDLRPRLCIFRSLRFTYAQLISDESSRVLGAASTQTICLDGKSAKGKELARELGKVIGGIALERGLSRVVFDRNGYRYHGRVSAVADGAREVGLDF